MSTPSRFSRIDLILLGLVGIWGFNFSVVKGAIGPGAPFEPIVFNALRFCVAAVTLLAWLRAARVTLPASRRDWLSIAGLGLLGNTLYQVMFIVGLNFTSPATSSLIVALTPVIVALISAAFGLDRLAALAWIGIVMSFGGIVIVVLGNQAGVPAGQAGASPLTGDLLVLGSTSVWAVYTVLAAPMLKRYSATLVTSLSLAAGTLPLFLVALPDLLRVNWNAVPAVGWTAVLFSGVFALAIGYVAWNHGVKHIGGARTAVYANLIPVFAGLAAWQFRGDPLTVYHLIGAVIVLAGINLTRIGRQATVEPLPAEE